MSNTNRAAQLESLRLAAMNAYAAADRAAENNDPAEHVSELYAAAQESYRALADARSQVTA